MAMMDSSSFLISHIRNSFITSDDTGMCEVILEAEQLSDKKDLEHLARLSNSEVGDDSEVDVELAHSYDIMADTGFFDSHRRRSNTAQRLDKMKRDKHKQSKIKHVNWKEGPCPVEDLGDYFDKSEVVKPVTVTKSMLSLQLENKSSVPNNPYMNYAKFDGRASGGLPTKKIEVFLTMAFEKDRPYPITIVTLATAKVQDLIGLICWQYFTENRTPPLPKHLDGLSLHIAEDDGEVDRDFPALDNKEPFSKFGFFKLALVQKHVEPQTVTPGTIVTIDMQHRGLHRMSLENDSMSMKVILDDVLQKYDLHQRPGLEYRLEKHGEPGVPIDMNLPLNGMDTKEFYLMRENSAREKPVEDVSPRSVSEMEQSLSSMRYQSFVVSMQHKLRTIKEVQLGISGEKIEIDPLSTKGMFKQLQKAKPVTIDMVDVAACAISESKVKHHGKCIFRLVHRTGHEFRNQDFECEMKMAQEIVQKVKNILEMRSSPVSKDYKAQREKKAMKKLHT